MAGRHRLIEFTDPAYSFASGSNFSRSRHAFIRNVGNRISKPVHVHHFAIDPVSSHPRCRPLEPHEIFLRPAQSPDGNRPAQMRSRWSKDVAAVKRSADGWEEIF